MSSFSVLGTHADLGIEPIPTRRRLEKYAVQSMQFKVGAHQLKSNYQTLNTVCSRVDSYGHNVLPLVL